MESDVREKILETARCIFLKEGYKGTTINSIARAAGTTTYPLRYPQPVDESHPCSFPPNVENHVDKWWISGVSRCISRA